MNIFPNDWRLATEILGIPPFSPQRFIGGGQRQTIIAKITGSESPSPKAEVVKVPFADGDSTYLEIDHGNSDKTATAPMVVLLHGLGGSSESDYVVRISRKIASLGIRAVRFNHRGAAKNGGHLSRGIYHAGSAPDVLTALKVLDEKFPDSSKVLVGFSLSGAIILNLIAEIDSELAEALHLKGAMAVCCPLDLELSSQALSKVKNRHYDIFFTRMLKQRALQLHSLFPEQRYPALPNKLNLRIFDEVFTAPVGGFESRNHYYQSNSPIKKLKSIRMPTMILQAADDPVVPRVIYRKAFSVSDQVRFALEPCGGHMGFLSREINSHGDRRWMDLAVISWCSKLLGGIS